MSAFDPYAYPESCSYTFDDIVNMQNQMYALDDADDMHLDCGDINIDLSPPSSTPDNEPPLSPITPPNAEELEQQRQQDADSDETRSAASASSSPSQSVHDSAPTPPMLVMTALEFMRSGEAARATHDHEGHGGHVLHGRVDDEGVPVMTSPPPFSAVHDDKSACETKGELPLADGVTATGASGGASSSFTSPYFPTSLSPSNLLPTMKQSIQQVASTAARSLHRVYDAVSALHESKDAQEKKDEEVKLQDDGDKKMFHAHSSQDGNGATAPAPSGGLQDVSSHTPRTLKLKAEYTSYQHHVFILLQHLTPLDKVLTKEIIEMVGIMEYAERFPWRLMPNSVGRQLERESADGRACIPQLDVLAVKADSVNPTPKFGWIHNRWLNSSSSPHKPDTVTLVFFGRTLGMIDMDEVNAKAKEVTRRVNQEKASSAWTWNQSASNFGARELMERRKAKEEESANENNFIIGLGVSPLTRRS
jgi:hypothetical protein